jgi:hypothetical protein
MSRLVLEKAKGAKRCRVQVPYEAPSQQTKSYEDVGWYKRAMGGDETEEHRRTNPHAGF